MIPIIWRYLLTQYLRVLLLSVVAFVAILMTLRLNDIAHFASFGAQGLSIVRFALHQIAYILPYALPISCFISSTLLIQHLSLSHELTALRSLGFSLRDTFTPLLIAAAFLSLLNFYFVSELATNSSLATSQLKAELRSINPLVLLHNKHLMKLKGIYFDTLGASRVGDFANDAILAVPNKDDHRLHLMLAKHLNATSTTFLGENVTFIANLSGLDEGQFDRLLIENIAVADTTTQDISQLFEDKGLSIHNEQLKMPYLLARYTKETNKRNQTRCLSEILRRFSTSIAVFTFTLMGLSFGISISRFKSSKSILIAVMLVAIYLMANLIARETRNSLPLSFSLYFLPHLLILFLSLRTIRRITKGIERRV